MRRVGFVLVVVAMATALGVGGAAVWARVARHAKVRGGDIVIHTADDTNFCLESEGDGSLIISQCAVRGNQRFTLTDDADGTNQIVDGYGECLDRGNGRSGTPLTTAQCNFGASQAFQFLRTSKLSDPTAKVCITAAAATQNASVFDYGCHKSAGSYDEIFSLTQ